MRISGGGAFASKAAADSAWCLPVVPAFVSRTAVEPVSHTARVSATLLHCAVFRETSILSWSLKPISRCSCPQVGVQLCDCVYPCKSRPHACRDRGKDSSRPR